MMEFRGLELHGKAIWDHHKVDEALDLAARYGLTALVLHESDFMTEFVYPRPLFDSSATWTGAPVRRGENALLNNQSYLKNMVRKVEKRDLDLWIEVKELTFPDEVLEKRPSLCTDGVICPTDPFWSDFIRMKYRDLLMLYPGIAGVIVSAGSPEGRAALSQRKCTCARCESTSLEKWYGEIITAIYDGLHGTGARLAVREFSYSVSHQRAITHAVNTMPEDVIYCIKVTPHDFYPTFPHNELIRTASGRPKWIEYDTMGQYYGWGYFPSIMHQDIESRFNYALENGVSGALLRVEWERVNDWWSLDTPNRMNLHAAALNARGEHVTPELLLRAWMEEEGIAASTVDIPLLEEFVVSSWPHMRSLLYINDFVFNDSSMFPMSIERAWWSMTEKHSLSEWFPERGNDLVLDAEKIERYLSEKVEAELESLRWAEIAAGSAGSVLPAAIRRILPVRARYARGFKAVTEVCLYSGWFDQNPQDATLAGAEDRLAESVGSLERYVRELTEWQRSLVPRHQVDLLLNPERAGAVGTGAVQRLKKVAACRER